MAFVSHEEKRIKSEGLPLSVKLEGEKRMGLTVSHGCFNDPYSRFNAWRFEISKAAGITLELMDGYYAREEGEPIKGSSL